MKVTGPWSVSSVLIVVLNVMRVTVAIVLVAALAIVAFAAFAEVRGLEVTVLPPSFEVNREAHNNWRVTVPVSLTIDDARVTAPALGIDRAEVRDLRGSLRFPVHRGSFFFANCVLLMLAIGMFLWLTTELQRVLRTVRDGQPFTPANARRIRRIGWIVIAGEFARTAIIYFENSYAAAYFTAEGFRFAIHPDFSIAALLEGCIILVIAEVFRVGTRLDEEQSLTV